MDSTVPLDIRKCCCASHGMDGACYGRCPAPAAGQAARRTHESLGILRACSGEAGVIGGQQYHDIIFGIFRSMGRNILDYILEVMLSR